MNSQIIREPDGKPVMLKKGDIILPLKFITNTKKTLPKIIKPTGQNDNEAIQEALNDLNKKTST